MKKKNIYKFKPNSPRNDIKELSLIQKENEQPLLEHKQFQSKKQKEKVKPCFPFDYHHKVKLSFKGGKERKEILATKMDTAMKSIYLMKLIKNQIC